MHQAKLFKALWVTSLVGITFFSGCSTFGTPTPTVEPAQVENFTPVVTSTGVVVPTRLSTLSMTTTGLVSELLVEENDVVDAGEILVRLKGKENLESAIEAAKFELATAEYDLEQLYKDTDVLAAEAYQSVVQFKQEIKDAERYLNNLGTPPSQADIDQAKANLLLAEIALDKARDKFEPYEEKKEDNQIRAALFSKLADAEKLYENATRRLNNLLGSASELDIEEAEADLALAKLNLQVAERDYEIYQNGPDPDDVRLAEERVTNAQAQLTAAEAALEELVLEAPFAGTVSKLYINQNEWISLGQPVLQLADLDHMRVETTDLNEIDVARIEIGDKALITFDALPEVEVSGVVERIAPKAGEGSGVNYPVVIALDEIPENVRWSMTAFVDIEVE